MKSLPPWSSQSMQGCRLYIGSNTGCRHGLPALSHSSLSPQFCQICCRCLPHPQGPEAGRLQFHPLA